MDIPHLIQSYGLIALFFGCLLEGETAAIAGGVLAHRHLLMMWQVLVVVACAALLSDSAFFLLSRRYRQAGWVRAALSRPAIGRIMAQVDAHPHRLASLYRFIPGMRILGPVALAQSRMPSAEFLLRALVSAVIWAAFYTVVGHAAARLMALVFGSNVHRAELIGISLLVVATALVGWLRHRRAARPKP